MYNSAKIFAISRLRIDVDGDGVRTLVCFDGCPLKCKMCPNREELEKGTPFWYTPDSLLESLKIDDVYYRASYGGITFGGGEPALQSEFIAQFSRMCPREWTVDIETSLNVDQEHVEVLAHVIDHWYIDIKDVNDKIYKKYTGHTNAKVLSNLQVLIDRGLASKITVRIPRIPGFNTPEDVQASSDYIKGLGIESLDIFTYSQPKEIEGPTMGCPVFPKSFPVWVRLLRIAFTLAVLICLGWICFWLFKTTAGAIVASAFLLLVALFFITIFWDDIGVLLYGKDDDDEWN